MWKPQLEQYQDASGRTWRIGWVLVVGAGRRYCAPEHPDAIAAGFTQEEMQALADELNAGEAGTSE